MLMLYLSQDLGFSRLVHFPWHILMRHVWCWRGPYHNQCRVNASTRLQGDKVFLLDTFLFFERGHNLAF